MLVAAAMALFHVPLIFIVGGVIDDPIPPDRYWFYLVFLFVVTPSGARAGDVAVEQHARAA